MFGCAMEIPETCVLVRNWISLKFRKVERDEDKGSIFIPLSAVGLLFIVLGIAVETYAEGKASDFDARLREYESDKITAAEGEATEAIIASGTAAASAKNASSDAAKAKTDSDGAVKAAAKAKSTASSAEQSAESVNKSMSSALAKISQIQAVLTPLELSPKEQDSLQAEFHKYASPKIPIEFHAARDRNLGFQIWGILRASGFTRITLERDDHPLNGFSVSTPQEYRSVAEHIAFLLPENKVRPMNDVMEITKTGTPIVIHIGIINTQDIIFLK